jgi:hypothetical protein
MALSGSGLAAVMKSTIQSIPESNRDFDTVWNAIGEAIITYIKDNAEITIDQRVSFVNGVQAGSGIIPIEGTCILT